MKLEPSAPSNPWTAAFTLIEVLVVLVIIAILAGISIPVSKYVNYRVMVARKDALSQQIHSALEAYRAVYGEYPITPNNNVPPDNLADVFQHYLTNTTVIVSNQTHLDISLYYPLMKIPLDKGEKPFMVFPEVTYAGVYNASGLYELKEQRRVAGVIKEVKTEYAGASSAKYPMAIDPLTQQQMQYSCPDGKHYTISTHTNTF